MFMKKFTRERVVPTISASTSCEILGSTFRGPSDLPWRASSSDWLQFTAFRLSRSSEPIPPWNYFDAWLALAITIAALVYLFLCNVGGTTHVDREQNVVITPS